MNYENISESIRFLTNELGEFNSIIKNNVLVSCTEAGRLLGVSVVSISRWIRAGRLKKTKLGDTTGILLGDILELKRRRDAPESQPTL